MGTTLSLWPKIIYQMVIIESTKYWRWGQLESVEKLETECSADSSASLDILWWAGIEEGGT